MKSTRLHELLDLVCAANYQSQETDGHYSICLKVGRWETSGAVFIHEHLDKAGENTLTVYSEAPLLNEIEDPDYIKAEAHIRRLMEGAA